MKRYILSTILMITSFYSACAQNSDCYKKMRTGIFKYTDLSQKAYITRTNKKQTEIFGDGTSKLISKITWKNDSVYVLKLKKLINAPGLLKRGDEIEVHITQCDGNSYYAEFFSKSLGNGECSFMKID